MSHKKVEYQIMLNMFEKLGLQDKLVLKKGEEFFRVYQSKSSVRNLNDLAKAILCLDLAATHLGINFDKNDAYKLSGLKKQSYNNSLHNVEKVLDIDKLITIQELCVQFDCSSIKDLANKILVTYKDKDVIRKDINHPQYIAVAVYTACKLKNIKVQKSQFVTVSRLKSLQWKELETEFTKFVDTMGLTTKNDKSKKRSEPLNRAEDCAKQEKVQSPKSKPLEDSIEDYEVWKARILNDAQKKLNQNNLIVKNI